MKNKYVFFDFCGTLVSNQTADSFVKFYLKKKSFLRHFKYYKANSKFQKLLLLRGEDKSLVDHFSYLYAKRLQKFNRKKLIEVSHFFKEKKYKIIIISAGYHSYIKEWAKLCNIEATIISNNLRYNENIFTGQITGDDCYGKNKLNFLKGYLNFQQIDWYNSYTFSDHFSDKPIFDLVRNKIFVTKDISREELYKLTNHEIR